MKLNLLPTFSRKKIQLKNKMQIFLNSCKSNLLIESKKIYKCLELICNNNVFLNNRKYI